MSGFVTITKEAFMASAVEIDSLRAQLDAAEKRVRELEAERQDLASMCRRLGYALKRSHSEGSEKLVRQCVEFLKKRDLGCEILRTME